MNDAIAGMFGKGGADGAPAADTAPSDDFRARYLGTDGKLDADKLLQSAWDTRRAHTTATQRVADLEKAAQTPIPATTEEYLAGVDQARMKELFPKVFTGDDASIAALSQVLDAARVAQIPPERAQAFTAELYKSREAAMPTPDTSTAAERRTKLETELGPNGSAILNDAEQVLRQRHQAQAFSDAELAALAPVLQSKDGVTAFMRLVRQQGAAPPDLGVRSGEYVDPQVVASRRLDELVGKIASGDYTPAEKAEAEKLADGAGAPSFIRGVPVSAAA